MPSIEVQYKGASQLQLRNQIRQQIEHPWLLSVERQKCCSHLILLLPHSSMSALQRQWDLQMTDAEHSIRFSWRMKPTSFDKVAKSVHKAWATVPMYTITTGFRKAGLIACPPECNNEVEPSRNPEANDWDSGSWNVWHCITGEEHWMKCNKVKSAASWASWNWILWWGTFLTQGQSKAHS